MPSTEKPKTGSPSIQSLKCTKPKSATKVSVKGGAIPNIKKLTTKKIVGLVKKPSVEKPKTKSPSIQYSKCTKPKSVAKIFVKGGTLPSTKKLTTEKIASLVKKPIIEKTKIKSPSIKSSNAPN